METHLKKVLIVDDDSAMRQLFVTLLRSDYVLAEAENGQAAQVQTGVARSSSSTVRTRAESSCEMGCPGNMSPMERTTRGIVTTAANQNRRFMSPSSWLSSL